MVLEVKSSNVVTSDLKDQSVLNSDSQQEHTGNQIT